MNDEQLALENMQLGEALVAADKRIGGLGKALEAAHLAGFMSSHEGFNGECRKGIYCGNDDDEPDKEGNLLAELKPSFEKFLKNNQKPIKKA